MARTDSILSTGVSIDSAIVGMTAMVNVNGSAWVCFSFNFSRFFFLLLTEFTSNQTIELGHQGEPVQDVILRIYRQTKRGEDNKRAVQGQHIAQLSNPWQEENHIEGYYSTRLTLGDGCDEVCWHVCAIVSLRDLNNLLFPNSL